MGDMCQSSPQALELDYRDPPTCLRILGVAAIVNHKREDRRDDEGLTTAHFSKEISLQDNPTLLRKVAGATLFRWEFPSQLPLAKCNSPPIFYP